MKIIKLTSENIKKLKAVEISPTESLVKITGKNAQGKSSVLDSILYALAGKKAIPDKPIRDGEEKAKITLDLGELIVERSFTETDSYLKVTTKEGAEYPRAQERLSALVQNISFDPLEFANMPESERVEILTQLLGIGEDLSKLDNEYVELYDERTGVNRLVKESLARLGEKPEDEYLDMKKIDVVEITHQLETEREKYTNIQEAKENISDLDRDIKEREEQLKNLKTLKQDREAELKKLEKDFDVEVGKKLKQTLEESSAINAKIDVAEMYKETSKEIEDNKAEQENVNKKIADNRKAREEIIAKAKMPIEGISITEEGKVTYNGIPFDQLSGAERLKVSLSVAMAMNPELRVIRILDGSLLDEDNLKVIEEMANTNDYQVWIEIVDSSGQVGFYIEDGELKN